METVNILKGTDKKILLIGKIKGLAEESKHTRKLLLKAKTRTRVEKFADTKRVIGLDIRHHLLAYAFMRGEAYSTLERKCRPEHMPNAAAILQIVHAHLPTYQAKNWTTEKVQAWLKVGV
jgi:hypothetical protein